MTATMITVSDRGYMEVIAMKKKKRWYLLWFAAAVLWSVDFYTNFAKGTGIDFATVMTFLAAVLTLVAGVAGHYRYQKNIENGEV